MGIIATDSHRVMLEDGTRVTVGTSVSREAQRALADLLAPPGLSILGSFGEVGGPGTIRAAYELLRRQVNGLTRIVDGLAGGARSPYYAGNIAAVSSSRGGLGTASHYIGQHLVDPLPGDDANRGIAPAVRFFRSVEAVASSLALNRADFVFDRSYSGPITSDRMLIELISRLENGATWTGAWIGDARGQTWTVQWDGTYFSRGGLLLLGDTANAILRGGDLYVESGGVAAVLDPNTTSDSTTGASLALARTSTTAAQIGDLYSIDLGTLTLQASTVRAAAPASADSVFKAKGLWLEGKATRPTNFDASNWGLWVDSDTDILYFWDGATDTALGGGSAAATTEYAAHPSWHHTTNGPFAWGTFGIALPGGNYTSIATGFETQLSRYGAYVRGLWAPEDGDFSLSFCTAVPEGFSSWASNALAVRTKITSLSSGTTIRMTLTAYNPSDGTTSTTTRDKSNTDDTDYVETTITPPGTWQGGDILRFTVAFTDTAWDGADTAVFGYVGRIRTDWS